MRTTTVDFCIEAVTAKLTKCVFVLNGHLTSGVLSVARLIIGMESLLAVVTGHSDLPPERAAISVPTCVARPLPRAAALWRGPTQS